MSHRRTKVLAALAVAALALVVFSSIGVAQESPPFPEADSVGLASQDVAPGWEHAVSAEPDLVGVKWSGDPGSEFTVEVQRGTEEWETVSSVGRVDNGPDPNSSEAAHADASATTTNASEPVWVGNDVSAVRVRLDDGAADNVDLQTVDAATPTTPAHSALVVGRVSGWILLAGAVLGLIIVSRRWLVLLVVAALAMAGCVDPGASVPSSIVLRSSWGNDLPWSCYGYPEYSQTVTQAIVHHTVNSNDYTPEDAPNMIRAIWGYHVYTLGYCDIAYNFLIDKYGKVYEGRLGGIENAVVGAHSLNNNYSTTGIALLGTYTTVEPPPGTVASLKNLIAWKFQVHHLDFNQDAMIIGHRDVYATECPGQAVYNLLPSIRADVRARMNSPPAG